MQFRSLRLSVRFGSNNATLRGVGLVGGKRVPFVVVAIDNGAHGDVFRITWGGRTHGGKLLSGNVVVR